MTALDTPGRLETRSVPLPLEEERAGQPHLKRTLGRIDLVLPLVAAAFSIRVTPERCGERRSHRVAVPCGNPPIFLPEAIVVIELSRRFPEEAGIRCRVSNLFRRANFE